MATPNFGDQLHHGSKHKVRNRSVDVQEVINQRSIKTGGENYNLALNEVLQIVGCQNLAELI